MLKRYLLFCGWDCYPSGGWHDFEGSFDTIEEAKMFKRPQRYPEGGPDWFHVIDSTTGEEVA